MTKRPRDFDIQCQLDDITTELKKAKKQVRVAQSNVEATESAKDALKARVDKIKQKLETPGLSEQEKAALIAKRKKRVANLQYVDKELQLCMEVSQLRSKKLELLKEMEQLLLNWLDGELGSTVEVLHGRQALAPSRLKVAVRSVGTIVVSSIWLGLMARGM